VTSYHQDINSVISTFYFCQLQCSNYRNMNNSSQRQTF